MDIFKIVGKIALDGTEDFEKEVNQARETGMKLSEKIGSGLAKVAKFGVAAVATAATALGAIGKSSLESFAEYEQLVGGAQLMFGNAYQTVAEHAKTAYKDVQMSQSEYLKQANGLATGLKTALGGNEQAAADLAHRVITAEADIVAATGNTQENIQNAFNGIMKSNFSMLDNLQIGITPTKEGFQEVIDKVNDWNESMGNATDYQIDNLADCQSALVDYIDMMGYSGYASEEASGTISGSIASMKSAWSDFLTGMVATDQDFDVLFDNLVQSVITVKDNIVPKIQEMLPKLVEGVSLLCEELGPEIGVIIKELLPSLIQGAVDLVADFIANLPEILGTLATAIKDALVSKLDEAGLSEVGDVIESVFTWVTENKDAIVAALAAIAAGFGAIFVGLQVASIVSTITATISAVSKLGSFAAVASKAIAAIGGPVTIIIAAVAALVAGIVYLWNTNEDFRAAVTAIWDQIKQVFASAWDWIKSVWDSVQPYFASIWESIQQIFTVAWEVIQAVWSFAAPFFEMVWNTIESIFSVVASVLGGFFQMAWSAISAAWSIAAGYFQTVWDTIQGIFAAVEAVLSGDFQGAWDAIQGILVTWAEYFRSVWEDIQGVFADAVSVGKRIVDDIKEGIKNAWAGLVAWFEGLWASLFGNRKVNVGVETSGSHAGGLSRVPFDGYIAELHKDEMVLTKTEADAYRNRRSSPETTEQNRDNAKRENTSGITIIQNIQTVPLTPVEIAAATQSYFEQARWAF